MDPIAVTSLAVAGGSFLISIGAWRTSHRSATAANTSAAADALTSRIEAQRRHGELTPQFEVTARPGNLDRVDLWIELTGPSSLGGLDRIIVSIRDDIPGRTPVSPAGPSAEEIAAQVWATHRFAHGADGADEHGRAVSPFGLRIGERRQLALQPARAPYWTPVSDEEWRAERSAYPFVLELACSKDGLPDWTVPMKVQMPELPKR